MRVILGLTLFFTKPLSATFFIIYSLCGISDFLDGYIARKTSNTSNLGASLDSIADFLFIVILMYILLPILTIPTWIVLWIFVIVIIRVCSLLVGFIKYHSLAFLHTYANKTTGILLFCYPIIIIPLDMNMIGFILCTIASVSAIEELMINIKSKELIRDVKSIFVK